MKKNAHFAASFPWNLALITHNAPSSVNPPIHFLSVFKKFLIPSLICSWLRSLRPNYTTFLRGLCFCLFLSVFALLLLIFRKFHWSEIELAFNTNMTQKFALRNFYLSRNFNRFSCIRPLQALFINLNLKFTPRWFLY